MIENTDRRPHATHASTGARIRPSMMRRSFAGQIVFGLIFTAAIRAYGVLPEVTAVQSYLVVASEETAQLAEWQEVITVLREKYDASLILYPGAQVAAVLPELARLRPRYTAFVARPEEAGRDFVLAIHRLTRRLDDDPYGDTQWGIITGYEAADALRIARRSEPLIVRSAASSMGPDLFKNRDHGFASVETNRHLFWSKAKDGELVQHKVEPDPVRWLVEAFNNQPPDLWVTSGHATEKDWQVIFNVDAGHFRCGEGQLFGLDSKGTRYEINSPHPKIYLPMGNCLIGHIPARDCMATAWMHSGGVHQMIGYTVVSFHGYMGWGVGSFFGNQYRLADAFFFNNQALLWDLYKNFPDQANITFNDFSRSKINLLAAQHRITDRHLMGQLWDRDTLAFYGDPAWVARYPLDDPAWRASYARNGEHVRVTVTILKDGTWEKRPLAIPFPERLGGIRGIQFSLPGTPLVTDSFALLPVAELPRQAGEILTLNFGAHAIETLKTSANDAPIRVEAMVTDPANKEKPEAPEAMLKLTQPEARQLAFAIRESGENRSEILQAIQQCTPDEVKDMLFLVFNMPSRDLKSLKAGFLLENLRLARAAWMAAPWQDQVDESMFREYILPYANLTEKREDWRKQFREELEPVVVGIQRPGEAAVALNQSIFKKFKVAYHATKRPRPDQGPIESIQAGYASCSGLAVLLVNACRAVGIPARIVGVAQWTKGPGNHTWVEVWDNGWHCLGAAESKELNDVWFGKGAAAADTSDPMKRVYTTRFSRSTLIFPMAWDPYAKYVYGVDVSDWYKQKFGDTETPRPVANE